MTTFPDDPCFACTLPDCDEDSPKCGLKVANRKYSKWQSEGKLAEVPPEVRSGRNAWFEAYRLERDARLSEGSHVA